MKKHIQLSCDVLSEVLSDPRIRPTHPERPAIPALALRPKTVGEFAAVAAPHQANQRRLRRDDGGTRPTASMKPTSRPREIDALVTTSHVFQPNERRNAVLSLRFSLPNCEFLGKQLQRGPPGGVARRMPLETVFTDHLTRKFYPKWPT